MGKKESRTEKDSFVEERIFGDHHYKTTITDGQKKAEGRGRTAEKAEKVASDKWDKGETSSTTGCFLTTACIQWAGLPDNCEILEEFRHFRDGYMMEEDDRAELVKQYYYLSPLIVSKIEKDPNKNEILKQLYSEGILPAFSKIKEGDFKSAMILYSTWTRQLAERYGVLTN